jgi:hypothetical protein
VVAGNHLHQTDCAAVALRDRIESRLDGHHGDDQQRIDADHLALAISGTDELARRLQRNAISPRDGVGHRFDFRVG